mmetsp:Transcript_88552/g.129513  ORF Transcript_88552/g.129513 Transcript_88552/m.129513 type:complete len:230 (+) Transcript_88552:165-854(+)
MQAPKIKASSNEQDYGYVQGQIHFTPCRWVTAYNSIHPPHLHVALVGFEKSCPHRGDRRLGGGEQRGRHVIIKSHGIVGREDLERASTRARGSTMCRQTLVMRLYASCAPDLFQIRYGTDMHIRTPHPPPPHAASSPTPCACTTLRQLLFLLGYIQNPWHKYWRAVPQLGTPSLTHVPGRIVKGLPQPWMHVVTRAPGASLHSFLLLVFLRQHPPFAVLVHAPGLSGRS